MNNVDFTLRSRQEINLDLEALDLNRSEILFESSEGRVPVRVLRDFVCSPFMAAATFRRPVKWLIPC